MAQHIGIQKIDENGIILDKSDVNFADVVNFLNQIESFEEKYPSLASVDIYGTTLMNKSRCSSFRNDLLKLRKEIKEVELMNEIEIFVA